MFSWFKPEDFLTALTAEFTAMIVEVAVIVKIIDWLRRRDDSRRLKPYRARVRKLLGRALAEVGMYTSKVLEAMTRYRGAVETAKRDHEPLPPPEEPIKEVTAIKLLHERLGRDYTLSLPHLDDATGQIYEAWLDQMETTLAVWSIWRMTDPGFLFQWSEDRLSDQEAYIRSLDEAERSFTFIGLVAASIAASLFYAESSVNGDEHLLKEASKFRNGTHVLFELARGVREPDRSIDV